MPEVKPLSAEEIAVLKVEADEALNLWGQGCADWMEDFLRFSAPKMFSTIEHQQEQIAALEKDNGRLRKEQLEKPAFRTFVSLKFDTDNILGRALRALQNGNISRGRCCEIFADVAHGVEPAAFPGPNPKEELPDDVTPLEAWNKCAALEKERDGLQAKLTAGMEFLQSTIAVYGMGVSAGAAASNCLAVITETEA